jgi:hypothetical protein
MKTWFLGIMLLLSLSAQAENLTIHTLELKHRLAEEVVPQIEAFLPDNATIAAYGNKLILKSDRATLANVETLLKQLDKAEQAVIVSVMRTNTELSKQQRHDTRIKIEAGDDVDAAVSSSHWSTRQYDDSNQHYQLRGVSGNPLAISLGEDVAQQRQLVFVGPRGAAVSNDTQYISTANGFRAVPFVLPDNRVRVEIHPFFGKLSRVDGDIEHSDVITMVVGDIGQWLEIGRISHNASTEQKGITSYRSHGEQSQYLYLKIDTTK